MRKLKLTDLQKHRLKTSYAEGNAVLQEIKRLGLTGPALDDMKVLENSVATLGALLIRFRVN